MNHIYVAESDGDNRCHMCGHLPSGKYHTKPTNTSFTTPNSRIHTLKSWVGLFQPIFDGLKTHDLRVLDRDYRVGDLCHLREYEPTTKVYTGRECTVEITYITSKLHSPCAFSRENARAFSPFTLHEGMGVLSIKRI